MRFAFWIISTMMAFSVWGFNSERWLAGRELVTKEAMRLRELYWKCASQIDSPAEGVIIPLDTFQDGSVKLRASAKRAQFFMKSGLVWIDDVVIVKYDDEHNEITRIEAAKCVFDRNKKIGWVEGHAKITHGKTIMEGDGVYFSSDDGCVTSFGNSKIVSSDLKFGGAL